MSGVRQEVQFTQEEMKRAARAYATQARAEYYKRRPEMRIAHRLTTSANLLARYGLIEGREHDAIIKAIPAVAQGDYHG